MVESKLTTCFCGNPGSGKSTLLNCKLERVAFKSGTSVCGGLTEALQYAEDKNGQRWADTPGLDDVKTREQAAKEITKSLKFGGLYRLCFVIGHDSGRLRYADTVMIESILKSTKLQQNEFGILVNNVNPIVKARIDENPSLFWDPLWHLICLKTKYVHINVEDPALLYQDNKIVELPKDLTAFIDSLPKIGIKPEDVQPIKVADYKKLEKEMQEKLVEHRKQMQEKADQIQLLQSRIPHEWEPKHHMVKGRGLTGEWWQCLNPSCQCHNAAWLYWSIRNKPACTAQCSRCYSWQYKKDYSVWCSEEETKTAPPTTNSNPPTINSNPSTTTSSSISSNGIQGASSLLTSDLLNASTDFASRFFFKK